MTWASRQVVVPIRYLHIDPSTNPSPKASPQQLQQIAQSMRRVQERIDNGWTDQQLNELAQSNKPQERLDAQTYIRLHQNPDHIDRFEAELVDQKLQLTRGAHRIGAARTEGLTHVPVTVRAENQRELDRVCDAIEQQQRQVRTTQPRCQATQPGRSNAARNAGNLAVRQAQTVPTQTAPTRPPRTNDALGRIALSNARQQQRPEQDQAKPQRLGRERSMDDGIERLEGRGERHMDR